METKKFYKRSHNVDKSGQAHDQKTVKTSVHDNHARKVNHGPKFKPGDAVRSTAQGHHYGARGHIVGRWKTEGGSCQRYIVSLDDYKKERIILKESWMEALPDVEAE